jgi:hypothetical protein
MLLIAENPNLVPLFPPQIPLGLPWDGRRISAVRGQRLTFEPWHCHCEFLTVAPYIPIYVYIDESALPSFYLGVREPWRFFTLRLWVRGVSRNGDVQLMSYASLESRNKT